jgi:hypothetical protein
MNQSFFAAAIKDSFFILILILIFKTISEFYIEILTQFSKIVSTLKKTIMLSS